MPSNSHVTRRAVVVLPLVPVMTTAPWVRSSARRVRIFGSIALATSPGRVVPPPRRVMRLNAPVALPAQTAAVFLNIGASRRGGSSRDRLADRCPAVQAFDRGPRLVLAPGLAEERGAAACDPPPRAQFFRELVQARLDVLRRAAQALALDLVPRPVNGLGRQLDTRPGDREPDGLDWDRRWRHTLAPSLDDGCAAAQEEGHVRTHLCGDRLEVEVGVEVGAVQRLQRAQRRGRIRARATHARARWYALVEMKPRRQLSIHGALERLLGLQHGVVIVAELEPRNSQLGGVGSGDDQQVVQLNRLHGRSQLVVAVAPPLDDFEVEV